MSSSDRTYTRRQKLANRNRLRNQKPHDEFSLPDELLLRSAGDREAVQRLVKDLEQARNGLERENSEIAPSRVILAFAYYALGNAQQCLALTREQGNATFPVVANYEAASHDLDLKTLNTVLEGMALETIAAHLSNSASHPPSSSVSSPEFIQAIATYRSLPTSPPPPIPEAQRYIEMGLSRLAALEARSSSLSDHLKYISLTSSFSNVSSEKRLSIYYSYLTLLHNQLMSAHSINNRSTSIEQEVPETGQVQKVFKAYERLLQTSPSLASFPRAGDATHNMTNFLDLLYSFWLIGSLSGEWVVESLHRALTKTYASQKLLRYLVYVLSSMSFSTNERAKGKTWAEDALRNLRLYIALFQKSRETDQAAIRKELETFRKRTEGSQLQRANVEKQIEEIGENEDEDEDVMEDDDNFCQVCCIGTRLLLRESGMDGKQEQGDERLDLIKEAYDTIQKAQNLCEKKLKRKTGDKITQSDDRDDKEEPAKVAHQEQMSEGSVAKAEVLLWAGIAKAEFSLAEADPELARTRAKQALASVTAAISALPSLESTFGNDSISLSQNGHASLGTSILYSLAFAQLELRDVGAALVTAKMAVESLPAASLVSEGFEFKVWHLFVLTLSASKKWSQAKQVAELALLGEGEGIGELDTATDHSAPQESTNIREEVLNVQSPSMHAVTRGDAPYDPIAISTAGGDAARRERNSNPLTPVLPSQLHNGNTNGRSNPNNVSCSESGSNKTSRGTGRSNKSAGSRPLKTTSDWDDVEAEIDLWITRNRCIEAMEGPDAALQDLQANVFTRFSKRRDDLESSVASLASPTSSANPASISVSTMYPYPGKDTQGRKIMADALNDQPSTGSDTLHTGRARSIIGSISHRRRSTATSIRRNATLQIQAQVIDHSIATGAGNRPPSALSNISTPTSAEHSQADPYPNAQNARASFDNPPNSDQEPANRLPAGHTGKNLHPQASRILAKLWLSSAASFRRWGKFEECRGAIYEAEDVAGDVDPEIWVQYGLYLVVASPPEKEPQQERAMLSMQKALSISTDDVHTVLTIAKIHLDNGEVAMAEGFLDVATQSNAWDSPEAWFLLAKVYEQTRRAKRARECLVYALGLEETRPIRELRATLDRYL